MMFHYTVYFSEFQTTAQYNILLNFVVFSATVGLFSKFLNLIVTDKS